MKTIDTINYYHNLTNTLQQRMGSVILYSFKSKDIAKKLGLSTRIACNITQAIYNKAGVSSKRQIIDYCYEQKINNYIPQSFFESTGSFTLI